MPGSGGWIDGSGANHMRLSFSAVPEDVITDGIERIAKVIREQMDLYRALRGSE